MKPRTVAHCFGLLGMLTLVALVGQFLFSSLFRQEPLSVFKVFPISSLPLIAREITHQGAPREAEVPQQRQVHLVLKNGQTVKGRLVHLDEGWVTLRIDGSDVGFRRSEVEAMSETAPGASAAN